MRLPLLRRALFACAALLVLLLIPDVAAAAPFDTSASDQLAAAAVSTALPTGFTESVAWGGITEPTTLRFAPDGRVFVALKSGIIDVYDNVDDQTPTVYADLRTEVADFWDRGLLGIALDPQFDTGRPYVYALYTYNKDPNSSQYPRWPDDSCPSPPGPNGDGCVVTGRLSRISPDGTEKVLIEDWCNQYPTHSIGSVNFGPDGALYVGSGDGASYTFADYGQAGDPLNPCGDPPAGAGGTMKPPTAEGGALRSQSFRRAAGEPVPLNGAILRVDPDTGAALPDNPAFSDPNPNRRRIIAYGMRNPYRFTFRPGTNEIWFGDVGWDTWEEINRIPDPLTPTVRDYGWPCYEGGARMPAYDSLNLNMCENLYSAGASAVTPPYYEYNHGEYVVGDRGCPTGTSSTTGVGFYTGTKFPAHYQGGLFFADYARNCIFFMPKGANGLPDPAQVEVFATQAAGPVDLQMGPDGAMYYVNLEGNSIRRIAYPAGNDSPAAHATATPDHGDTPLTVTFDGSASTDPDNDPLTYAWDLDGDGQFDDGSGITATFTYTTPGNYTARLRVSDPGGASDTTSIPITAGNAPTATIDTPSSSLTWSVGDNISFSGHAVDGQGNPIPASGLSWALNIRHCSRTDATVCHTHFAQTFPGVASGSFSAPDHDYPSHLELILTATDAHGLSSSKTIALMPQTVQLTVDSDPAGATLTIGADTGSAPFTLTYIRKTSTTVTAPSPQDIGGIPYSFSSWSDGGAISHTISPPTSDTTYKATFARAANATLAGADVVGNDVSQAAVGHGEVYKTSGTTSGTANSLRLYVDPGSTARQLVLGLYADKSGAPGALIGQGKITSVTAGAWNEVTLSTGIPITAGTAYWFGLLNPSGGSGTLKWRDRAGATGGAEQTSKGSGLAALPATWSTGGRYTDGPVSGYAFGSLAGPPPPPELSVSPASLSFTGSGTKSVSVSNTGGGTLNFTASDDQPWLSVTPSSGTAPKDLTVTVDATGLAPGTYNGNVTITASGASGSPKTVPVSLTIAGPALSVSPSSLSFSATTGGAAPAAQPVTVSNTGGGTLSFTASDDQSWLSVAPASGSAPATLSVAVDPTGLAAGTYNGTVTVTAPGATGSPKTVAVTLTVSAPSTGLVGAWGFDETSGSTTADASGKANTGTIANATRTTSGKFGGALTFNGTNAWVTVNDSASLHLTTGMTIEGWVNPTTLSGSWRAMAVKETATGLAWALYPAGDGGFPSGHAFTANEQWARGTSVLPLNTWSHVATTYDGTTIRTYVNGVQVGTKAQSGSLVTSTQPLRFGGDNVWPEWFKGSLDEIRVYDHALTAAQIQGDMTRAID